MPRPRKFFSGPWWLRADPPPCDQNNPTRALAYCEKSRHGQRCTCQFDLAAIADDLEELGLEQYASEFEDEVDADSLMDLVSEISDRVGKGTQPAAERLREELALLRRLAAGGSGVRPGDEV